MISDRADLEAKENKLDELLKTCTLQLRMLTEDPDNSRLAYVSYQDIRSIKSFEEQTVIAIKAPPETLLEVPDPTQVITTRMLYQGHHTVTILNSRGVLYFCLPAEGSRVLFYTM